MITKEKCRMRIPFFRDHGITARRSGGLSRSRHFPMRDWPELFSLSNEGTCYEPGEFCRTTDHGKTGVAGDGKAIKCEDNDGWRWEPV